MNADRAMCTRSDCPKAPACLRFRAKPAQRQVYNAFEPRGCDAFLGIEGWDRTVPFQEAVQAARKVHDTVG